MNTLRKVALWLQIRSLEITAHGQVMALSMMTSVPDWQHLKIAHADLLAEISRLKAEYRKLQRGTGLKAWRSA